MSESQESNVKELIELCESLCVEKTVKHLKKVIKEDTTLEQLTEPLKTSEPHYLAPNPSITAVKELLQSNVDSSSIIKDAIMTDKQYNYYLQQIEYYQSLINEN